MLGDGEEDLKFSRELLLAVEAVGEVDAAEAAIRVDLYTQSLDVIRPVGAAGEVGEVELDLIPAVVETHGHGADEGLDGRAGLEGGGPEAAANVLVI